MRNLIAGDIEVGNLEGIGPWATSLDSNAPTLFTDAVSMVIQIMILIAGLYALINFILAGYLYLSAGNDSKKISDATAKIWQSILGLLVAAGSVLLASIVSYFLFGDFNTILAPVITTP